MYQNQQIPQIKALPLHGKIEALADAAREAGLKF